MTPAWWMFLGLVKMTSAGEHCLEDSPSMSCVEKNRQLLTVRQFKGTVDTDMEVSEASEAVADEHQEGSRQESLRPRGALHLNTSEAVARLTAIIASDEEGHDKESPGPRAHNVYPYEMPKKYLPSIGDDYKGAMVVYFGTFTKDYWMSCVTPRTQGPHGSAGPRLPLECNKGNKIAVINGKAPEKLSIWEDRRGNVCASARVKGTSRFPLHVACLRKPTPAPTPAPTPEVWSLCKKGNRNSKCLSGCFATWWGIDREVKIKSDCEEKGMTWKKAEDPDGWKTCVWAVSYAGYCWREEKGA